MDMLPLARSTDIDNASGLSLAFSLQTPTVLVYDNLCEHAFSYLHLSIIKKIKSAVDSLSLQEKESFAVALDVSCLSTIHPGLRVSLCYGIDDVYSHRDRNGIPRLQPSLRYFPCQHCWHDPSLGARVI
eukprot:3919817-Rhodomonas_salina.1